MTETDWRVGNEIGYIYMLAEEDMDRVSGWMKERLFVGDVCLCIEHTGDCFYDYILLDIISNVVEGIPGSRFGCYVLCNDSCVWKPTEKEFHLLCSGSHIFTDKPEHPLYTETEALYAQIREQLGD